MRSFGMTPQEFVKKCWYVQEGVLLDFWPTDDKYKEMLVELNLQLAQLQMDSFNWLRQHVVLGPLWDFSGNGEIPEFEMPPEFYMPAMAFKDSVQLVKPSHACHSCKDHCCSVCRHPKPITVPKQVKWCSPSSINSGYSFSLYGDHGLTQVADTELRATYTGQGIITFNRPLTVSEQSYIAETDMIIRIPQVHICDDTCANVVDHNAPSTQSTPTPCDKIEKRILEFMPDPDYMIYKVVASHGAYSPTAQIAASNAAQKAQEYRSQISENDAMKTTPDIIHRRTQTFNMVI